MLINSNLIELDLTLADKEAVITKVAEILDATGRIKDLNMVIHDMHAREAEVSTCMGMGIAIPHAHSKGVKETSVVFIKLASPIIWSDDDEATLVFGILNAADNESNEHLKILSSLARKLMDEDFREDLIKAKSTEQVLGLLSFLL